MRTIEINLYKFDELNDAAKEHAREWYRNGETFPWSSEWLSSINAFCDNFGVKLKCWSIEPFGCFSYSTDADKSNFRCVKLRDIDRDNMPTGYCGDFDLWITFHDEFKRTGDAKSAFESAMDAGFKAWRADWEYSYTDESVDKAITINEYEFTENGAIA